jgi:hypothetical protein
MPAEPFGCPLTPPEGSALRVSLDCAALASKPAVHDPIAYLGDALRRLSAPERAERLRAAADALDPPAG